MVAGRLERRRCSDPRRRVGGLPAGVERFGSRPILAPNGARQQIAPTRRERWILHPLGANQSFSLLRDKDRRLARIDL